MARDVPQLMSSLETSNLPSLPHVLLRLLDACNRNETSLKAIAEILSKDTALCAKVLGASSSVLYGRQNGITTFEQKLIMLGLDMGLTRFKFFPAEASGGMPALKAIAAPFGMARFCPTGGITPASAPAWLALEPVRWAVLQTRASAYRWTPAGR